MLGILFTTPDEASTFVDRYADGRVDAIEEGTPVHLDDLIVAATGHGKINATLVTERLLRAHDLTALIHSGTCTALDDSLSIGDIVGASFVLEGDRVELDAPTYPRMPLECPFDVTTEGTLVSQDHTEDEKGYWERLADVRDSTGYAIAYVSAQHGTPCHVAKGVLTHRTPDASPTAEDRERTDDAVATFLQEVVSDEQFTEE